mgnify:FL=1|jgi:transcriptional regulator with XRE-family HTH domain
MKNVIGENIKRVREKKGMTQKELAEKCNLATITIRQYESGKREPKTRTLNKIAKALDVYILELTIDKHAHYMSILDIMAKDKAEREESQYALEKISRYIRLLNDDGKEKAIEQVELLTKIPEYKKDPENQDQE